VVAACHGQEAIDILEGRQGEIKVDMILTDILMPEVRRVLLPSARPLAPAAAPHAPPPRAAGLRHGAD
jgi:CheY-like chemotaxis protein